MSTPQKYLPCYTGILLFFLSLNLTYVIVRKKKLFCCFAILELKSSKKTKSELEHFCWFYSENHRMFSKPLFKMFLHFYFPKKKIQLTNCNSYKPKNPKQKQNIHIILKKTYFDYFFIILLDS